MFVQYYLNENLLLLSSQRFVDCSHYVILIGLHSRNTLFVIYTNPVQLSEVYSKRDQVTYIRR